MDPSYSTLKALVHQMVATTTKKDRDALCAQAIAVVQALETQRPAPDDALRSAHEAGALRALDLMNEVRREHEESFKAARYSAAGIVLNGVENYGQALCSQAESRISKHLNENARRTRVQR